MTPILTWLPDEPVFSLCSRYHLVVANQAPHQTTQDIFQHHYLGSSHDLPSRLDYFAARFDHKLGTAEEVATNHTILPFFHGFRDAAYAADSVARLTGKTDSNLKYRLGLLTGSQGASHPLKSCQVCVKEDRERFGVSYWHLKHQLPGAALCSTHQQPLVFSLEKTHGFHRFGWVLPEFSQRQEVEAMRSDFLKQSAALQGVLDGYFDHARRGRFYDPSHVGLVCSNVIRELGFVSEGGSYRWKPLSESFLDWLEPLWGSPYIAYLPRTPSQAGQFIAQTVRAVKYGRKTHPLNNLITICWLFESWEAFADSYKLTESRAASTITTNEHAEASQESSDTREAEVLQLLQSGLSVRQAALSVGVDTQTAVCWAKSSGHDFVRRPKRDKAASIALASNMLKRGKNKNTVERRSCLSRATINRLLRSDPVLKATWDDRQCQRRIDVHRHYWSRLGESNPDMTTQELRVISPATYSWLYRNDRDWLLKSNKKTNLGSAGNNSHVEWDQHYAEQVYKAAEKLSKVYPGSTIPRHQILREVPDVSKKIQHLSRLPLTYKALKRVT
jgi:hypothetical protein